MLAKYPGDDDATRSLTVAALNGNTDPSTTAYYEKGCNTLPPAKPRRL